jgi:hypothetical protein
MGLILAVFMLLCLTEGLHGRYVAGARQTYCAESVVLLFYFLVDLARDHLRQSILINREFMARPIDINLLNLTVLSLGQYLCKSSVFIVTPIIFSHTNKHQIRRLEIILHHSV